MLNCKTYLLCISVLVFSLLPLALHAQQNVNEERDIIDLMEQLLHKKNFLRKSNTNKKDKVIHASIIPAAGYTLQTGFAEVISTNLAFYTDTQANANLSTISANPTYTAQQQFMLPIVSSIWSKKNKWNAIGDWRYYSYPQSTFGLNMLNNLTDKEDIIYYKYLRFYETMYLQVKPDFFVGLGFMYDKHWNITEMGNKDRSVSDFKQYGLSTNSISSGISFNLMYDTRRNALNPVSGGTYVNIYWRNNNTWLGSDANWSALQLDYRTYIALDKKGNHQLALWNLDWLTLNGQPPYLDLPSTGWDTYNNSGRGYLQSRFRGKQLIYTEAEYRMNLTKNKLFGAVVFTNLQTTSDWPTNTFNQIATGIGAGLRIKFNKLSKTNIAIDYAFGRGSQGFFVNVGEVF